MVESLSESQRSLSRRRVLRRAALVGIALVAMVGVPGFGDGHQAPRAAAAAIALAALILSLRTDDAPLSSPWFRAAAVAVLFFGAWGLVAAGSHHLASEFFGMYGRFNGLTTAALLTVSFVTGLAWRGRDLRTLGRALAVVVLAQAVVVAVQRLGAIQPVGTLGNQMLLGSWLAVAGATIAACAVTDRGAWRRVSFVSSAAALVALGIAGSRGGMLAAGLGIAVAVYVARERRLKLAALLTGALVFGVILGGASTSAKLTQQGVGEGSSVQERIELWKGTAAMISDHPLVGTGPGRFVYEFPRYQSIALARIEPGYLADEAHNVPLHIAAEFGVPAGVAWLALAVLALGGGIRGIKRRDALTAACAAGLVAYLTQSMFAVSTVETDVLAWLLAGGIIGREAAVVSAADTHLTAATRGGIRAALAVQLVTLAAAASILGASAWYETAEYHDRLARELYASGNAAGAVEHEQMAVDLLPVVPEYRQRLELAAVAAGPESASEAASEVEEGLVLEPESFQLAVARAELLEATGAPPAAIAGAYSAAAQLVPRHPDVVRSAMRAASDADDPVAAREFARQLLQVLPDDPEAQSVIGDVR